MKLIYTATGKEVKIGDKVFLRDGEEATVDFFRKPHKSSSSGHVTLKIKDANYKPEYYVTVIGAKWINRDDQ